MRKETNRWNSHGPRTRFVATLRALEGFGIGFCGLPLLVFAIGTALGHNEAQAMEHWAANIREATMTFLDWNDFDHAYRIDLTDQGKGTLDLVTGPEEKRPYWSVKIQDELARDHAHLMVADNTNGTSLELAVSEKGAFEIPQVLLKKGTELSVRVEQKTAPRAPLTESVLAIRAQEPSKGKKEQTETTLALAYRLQTISLIERAGDARFRLVMDWDSAAKHYYDAFRIERMGALPRGLPQVALNASAQQQWIALALRALSLIEKSALADPGEDLGQAPGRGYVIQIDATNPIQNHSGQATAITGQIQITGDSDWDKNHGKGHNAKTLQQFLGSDDVGVQFFWPDATSEVTSQVKVNAADGSFSFTTPVLSAGGLNSFSAQITRVPEVVESLQRLKAKLDVRATWLSAQIAKLPPGKWQQKDLKQLQDLQSLLASISARITQKLLTNTDLLATAALPLQVDNAVAGPSSASTIQGQFRIQIAYDQGSAIDGEQTNAHVTVTNLRQGSHKDLWGQWGDWDNDDVPNGPWVIQAFWNGSLVKTIGPQAISAQQAVTFDYATGQLEPEADNMLSVVVGVGGNGHNWNNWWNHWSWNWDWNDHNGRNDLFAQLEWPLPTADDTVAPQWLAGSTPSASQTCLQTLPAISATLQDPFGLIDPTTFTAALTGAQNNGTQVNQNVAANLNYFSPDQHQTYQVSGDLNPLVEGVYTLNQRASDLAGNASAYLSSTTRIDRTPPVVSIVIPDSAYTNKPYTNIASQAFTVNTVDYFDLCQITTTLTDNGTEVGQGTTASTAISAGLSEGANVLQAVAQNNSDGISSEPVSETIVLDTTPPVLSNVTPANNGIVNTLTFGVSGISNEPLLSASVNGQALTLSPDGKSFSGSYSVSSQGSYTLTYQVQDFATNATTVTQNVQVFLHALIGSLISTGLDADGSHVDIIGAPGATQQGITVNAQASFLNTGSAVGAADGSFVIKMSPFTEATVTATNPAINVTDTVTVYFGSSSPTILSGLVKDTAGNALSGVKVSMKGTSYSTTTDGSGAFALMRDTQGNGNLLTGYQVVTFDGSQAVQPSNEAPEHFASTNISVNVGLNQANVLPQPVFLQGIPTDTPVYDNTADVTVTAAIDPSIALHIPAGAAQFPNGTSQSQIYMTTITPDKTTLPPPSYAQPKPNAHLIALEPSGTTFSTPVDLAMPNYNNLPPGTDVVVLSMNSKDGAWEIDGLASVSSDGSQVVTKPGAGITHFSTVYTSPGAPQLSSLGGPDKPGIGTEADAFNGAVSTKIDLPSMKVLGQDIAPELTYRSSAAKPTALVSELFNIDRQDYSQVYHEGGAGWLLVTTFDVTSESWIQPSNIATTFLTTGLTEPITASFDNSTGGLQNNGVISFVNDMKDNVTGQWLPTNLYPYTSHWAINLQEVQVTTFSNSKQTLFGGLITLSPPALPAPSTDILNLAQVFPADFSGTIQVQNDVNSPAGRGWHIGGVQKIVNPGASRVVIQESDGSLSNYAINNTISTVVDGAPLNLGMTGVDLSHWPNSFAATSNDGSNVYFVTLSNGVPNVSASLGAAPTWGSGLINGYDNYDRGKVDTYGDFFGSICSYCDNTFYGSHGYVKDIDGQNINFLGNTYGRDQIYWCGVQHYNYNASFANTTSPGGLVILPNGNVIGTDSSRALAFEVGGGSYSLLAGTPAPPPTFHDPGNPSDPASFGVKNDITNYCSAHGISCSLWFGLGGEYAPGSGDVDTWCANNTGDADGQSDGLLPNPGFNGDNTLGSTQLNNPMGIIAGFTPNTVVIADTGNNRVRELNLTTGQVTTIAGNGGYNHSGYPDSGDGGLATSAEIYSPIGLLYDSLGNLYISDAAGAVRRVDATTSIISTVVGGPSAMIRLDPAAASLVRLSANPYGMAIDNAGGYLYVADWAGNVVKRLNFLTQVVDTVAGNGNAIGTQSNGEPTGDIGDGGAAGNAELNHPTQLAVDSDGNLIIADSGYHRIRKVAFQSTLNTSIGFLPASQDHSTLTRNSDGTYVRGSRNGTHVYYNTDGTESTIVDRAGRVTSFSYSNGLLMQVNFPTGQNIKYAYSGNSLLSVTDSAGRTTSFNESGGLLNGVTFPDGTQKAYTYDGNGLMLSETNQEGTQTQYTYNSSGRVSSVTAAVGTPLATTQTMNDIGSQTTSNNVSDGKMASLNSGQLFDGITDARSNPTVFSPDTNGFVSEIVDANGNETDLQRDFKGKPLKLIRYQGNRGNGADQPDTRVQLSEIDYVYDSNNPNPLHQDDLLSQTDTATGITTYQTFDDYGNAITKTNGRGLVSNYTFDPNTGLTASVTDPRQLKTTYSYTPLGQIASKNEVNLGRISTATFDANGNQTSSSITLNGGRVSTTSSTFDSAGNVIENDDANGHKTCYAYDPFNRLTAVTSAVSPTGHCGDGSGKTTLYAYSPSGKLKTVTDSLGHVTSYAYNALDELVTKTDALGYATNFQYDANGNVIQQIDPNGNQMYLKYDSLNRLTEKRLPDNIYEYSYDPKNNPILVTNAQSSITNTYDTANRLLSSTTQGAGAWSYLPATTLSYSYDFDNDRATMTDPSGTTTYSYNEDDELGTMQNPAGDSFAFGFDSGNRLTSISRTLAGAGSSPISSAFTFDMDDTVSSILHQSQGSQLASFNYTRDLAGTITAIGTDHGLRTIASDLEYQTTGYSNPEAPAPYSAETFSYDAIYNRTQDQNGTFNYDNEDLRLVQDYENYYFYDKNGNLTSKQAKGLNGFVTNYSYSSENQLLGFKVYQPVTFDPSQLWSVSSSPIKEVTYTYDAAGRRVEKIVVDHTAPNDVTKTFTRRFVYDGSNMHFEYDASNALLASYTATGGIDDVLSVKITSAGVTSKLATAAGSYAYLKDNLGSITDVADATGAKILHYVYSAFGELLGIKDAYGNDEMPNPALRTSVGFTGRELDSESGLMYYRARYYDTATGRFLQKDPQPGRAVLPKTLVNSYTQSMNDPFDVSDPSGAGLFSWLEEFFIGLIAGLVAAIFGPLLLSWVGIALPAVAAATSTAGAIATIALDATVLGAVGAGLGYLTGGLMGGLFEVYNSGGHWSTFGEGWDAGSQIGALSGAISGAFAGVTAATANPVSPPKLTFGATSFGKILGNLSYIAGTCIGGTILAAAVGSSVAALTGGNSQSLASSVVSPIVSAPTKFFVFGAAHLPGACSGL